MATQPFQNQHKRQSGDSGPSSEDALWRILAKEAALEKDPNKLLEIVESLTSALDKETKARGVR